MYLCAVCFVWCESLIINYVSARNSARNEGNIDQYERLSFGPEVLPRSQRLGAPDADAGRLRKGGKRETDSKPEEHHELRGSTTA